MIASVQFGPAGPTGYLVPNVGNEAAAGATFAASVQAVVTGNGDTDPFVLMLDGTDGQSQFLAGPFAAPDVADGSVTIVGHNSVEIKRPGTARVVPHLPGGAAVAHITVTAAVVERST
jgi:hypothetical protein